MAVKKRILVSERLREVPSQDWSWIDRRFLREHADALRRDSILLYFFLCAVADKHGLSFYGERTISSRLRVDTRLVALAREELLARDLIAYAEPLYQVLSIPENRLRGSEEPPALLADVLAEFVKRSPHAEVER